MKIIFFGTPVFAAKNLEYLINNGQKIIAVVTPTDRKKGRGKKLKSCAVKETAHSNNITILQPQKLNSDNFINTLKKLNADLFIVVAFRMLPETVWKIPKKGTINLHASLLPNYRGAAPINRVLINGEEKTGISTFFINNKIDTGDIIYQEEFYLTKTTTAAQLHNGLIEKGNDLLIKTIFSIKNNSTTTIPQKNPKGILEAPKLTKELLKIDWKKSANDIHNLVRGLSPFINEITILKDISICPSAWFFLEDQNEKRKRIKIHLTEVINSKSNKEIRIKSDNKTYLHIITKKNTISIKNLQVEGKKPMTIKEFLQGNKITKNHSIE